MRLKSNKSQNAHILGFFKKMEKFSFDKSGNLSKSAEGGKLAVECVSNSISSQLVFFALNRIINI